MLHRSTSSRRRRASRSAASSPQTRGTRSAATSPGRRASIAVSPVDTERATRNTLMPDISRSPRHSIIPDFDRSPRSSLVPDFDRSPRNSLVPDSQRSPRHSLVPNETYSRSPRNSLVPDSALSPRNSLVPDQYNRSPRNSLVPESNKTPRHSLTPDNGGYGIRLNIVTDYNRSARNSLVPDCNRTPRQSLTPSESTTWVQEEVSCCNRSPRHSIGPESNRSPRGSIAPESLSVRTSPRGSIAGEYVADRSPRGSIGPENGENRSPRGSIARSTLTADESEKRSPRGSLTLTFQEPPISERRASADNPGNGVLFAGIRGRSTSPYRSASRGTVNMGFSGNSGFSESGSRRASSSVSQVSGDEQRRLCADQKYGAVDTQRMGLGLSLTTYGSVAYQLKDANLEATGTCDFVCKALSIVNKTVVVTIVLVCLSVLPLIMLIMGFQFLRDCPREPYIPIYMVVGGGVGCIKMGLTLYSQLHTRRLDVGAMNTTSAVSKVASVALTMFLIIWFSLGNYWILRIKWPDYAPKTLFEPNRWCDRTLYVFSVVHLCIIYFLLGIVVVLMVVLAGCQFFGCSWLGPASYK
ncbi:uncharacterized protein LOC108909572 [Anoplophora glabripennis]|uniref:uncharacterized protein LOC108909572 n=1 Tax=Anoplophora glabripennis TaxID=217634 RepID=UPI000C761943|nr:uncharacterized protein LOC108909572 [Anoplophora glabripennis]